MQTAINIEDLDGIIKDTGIELIDREHLRLVNYILEMGEVTKYSKNQAFDSGKMINQSILFERFIVATEAHYKTEEYFINKYGLKGIKEHHDEHNSILQGHKKLFANFKQGRLSTFQTVRIDLISDLIDHINVIDQNTFLLRNFLPALKSSKGWDDVSEIIKSTGLPFVDQQHEILTIKFIDFKNYLSDLGYRIKTKTEKEKTTSMLYDMVEYTEFHFENEEKFLKKYNLDNTNQSTQHQKFLTVVFNLAKRIKNNQQVDFEGFIEYLFSWWVNHINGIDYVEFHYTRIADPIFKKSETQDEFSFIIRKTGIEFIDNDHVHLIGILLSIKNKKNSGENINVKKELLALASFAALHFKNEEKFMEQQNIPGRDLHKEAHGKILRYIGEAIRHAISGRSQASPLFLKRVMIWWVQHTNEIDYDTFVLNRQLT